MTVINPNSISGITSITMPSGDGNVLTIHTNDGIERFRIDSSGNVKVGSACTISQDGDVFFTGVTTATTFTGAHSGSGANLTSLPAGNLTGTLPALDGSALTGVASTENIRTNTNATFLQNINVSGITTVGSAVTISESGIEASGIGITCANINGGQIAGRRNIIINGAMQIAQRGTSNTAGGDGYFTVDRMYYYNAGIDNDVTKAQGDVASGTSPYSEGLRKTFKLTNGNQTSPNTGDEILIRQNLEAIDMQRCGWNYTSSSSFITLSYWVKSSVSQNFYVNLHTMDGTEYNYVTETGTLYADTWTKVVKTIPGNSNLQFDSNVNKGMHIQWNVYRGTSATGTRPLNAWAAYSSSSRVPDMASTWWINTGATFELTGVQLEVGPQATPFEHLSFGEDLILCQRYFYKTYNYNDAPGTADFTGTIHGRNYDGASARSDNPINVIFPTRMRADPTITWYAGDGQSNRYSTGAGAYGSNLTSENTVGASFINSEIGVTAVSFSESVPALSMYAYHITAESEI